MLENDQLVLALQSNFARADRNRYNLEVLLTLAQFAGHHFRLLAGLSDAEKALAAAQNAAAQKNAGRAVGLMVQAYNTVDRVRQEGVKNFAGLVAAYEKSRYPKGRSVGGRQFVHIFDDTKDHYAGRTSDFRFMAAAEDSMGLDAWRSQLMQVIRSYAKSKNIPVKDPE